jgi:hypothetical protein
MDNKDFAPYQPSIDMKELGFDEPCFGSFDIHSKQLYKTRYESEQNDFYLLAPTFSQAFRFFREKYEYISFIRGRKSMGFDYTLSDVPTNLSKRDTFQSPHVYQTYEEAELACLIKLIEIVKNK